MMVASNVVLPTPLRPIMLTFSPGASARLMSSRTTVSPYPAETAFSSTALPMAGLPEIDVAHSRIGADLLRRAFHEDRTADHHGDALREAEHQIHVVVNDQYADVFRQRRDRVEDDVTFGRGHAGCGLV